MKNKINKHKNSNKKIQDSSISEGNPEIQDSDAAGDSSDIQENAVPEEKPEVQESADSEEKPEIQDDTAAADSPKLRTPFFQKIFRKSKGGKVSEDISEIQESIASEEEPEVQESTTTGDIPKLKTPFFQKIFRKSKGGKVSEDSSEIQESIASEEGTEVLESTAAGNIPEVRTPLFQRIFRKLKGSKISEDNPEIQESITPEEKTEIQESITSEEGTEVLESTAAGNIPEVRMPFFQRIFGKLKGSKVSEDNPEIQESIVPEEKTEIQESITSEEEPEGLEGLEGTAAGNIPEFKTPLFQRIFRKLKGSKISEDNPEIQESIVSEEKPEIQESIAPEETPEVLESTTAGDIQEFKTPFFQRIFRKSRGRKVTEETPEIQESIVAEEKPEVLEISEETKHIYLKKKKPWKLAKKIIISFASVLILALLTVGLYALSIFYNPAPLQGFETIAEQMATPTPSVLPQPSASGEPASPSPTVDPYDVLMSQADPSILKDTVNILLIGVDHGEERDSGKWNGKTAWHSDVMIVVSINTITNKVSLISLPRDTYAKIPGVTGIYKLNASLNCGGGWPKPKAFEKVCQAASWMIGGIPIQYYYAVDFGAVKGLVDAIGGVDFDLDITFKINGRKYKKGMQHMDGQAALDYMRVRHGEDISGSGNDTDLNRINRQKKMLVAVFDKLKSTGTIFSLPNILSAFEGKLFTNVEMSKTAGLAAYAYKNIDPKNISVYSMDGDYSYLVFDFNFVITDLSKRVSIIKKVYGIDISKSKDKKTADIYDEYRKYSHDRAWSLWYSMQTEVALKKSRSLLNKAKNILDADAAPAEPSTEPPTDPLPAALFYAGSKYGDKERQLYELAESEYAALKKYKNSNASDKRRDLIEKYKKDVQALCKALSIKVKKWDVFWQVVYNAKNKKSINQHFVKNAIYVDFR